MDYPAALQIFLKPVESVLRFADLLRVFPHDIHHWHMREVGDVDFVVSKPVVDHFDLSGGQNDISEPCLMVFRIVDAFDQLVEGAHRFIGEFVIGFDVGVISVLGQVGDGN